MPGAQLEPVVKNIEKRHRAWFRYFRRWRALFWTCGVVAATASALAAAKVAGEAAPYFAVLSSAAVAVLGFTNPQRRANAYVNAWRILGSALLRYQVGQCELSDVIEAVDRGEASIGEADTRSADELISLHGRKGHDSPRGPDR